MADKQLYESGKVFEQRALAIARAIHDPSGTQGPVMFQGREHDAVFVDDRAVVAFEFTQLQSKAKAEKDAGKLRDVLRHLAQRPENRYKMVQGFLVTMTEPTGEQRSAVERIGRAAQIAIQCLSLVALRRTLIDTERYLSLRRQAPFGSTAYRVTTDKTKGQRTRYIEQRLEGEDGSFISLDVLLSRAETGDHYAILADYGSGKSEALRQMFERLRSRYFKAPSDHRFPLHINLAESFGLKNPPEVLRRHAESIGFTAENSLIAAWRSGDCTLLLDGFDELVPSRWVGGAKDLRQVRRQALEPVRRLVEETPQGCGIVVSGRSQYFSGTPELLETLALDGGAVVHLPDFDEHQVQEFLE